METATEVKSFRFYVEGLKMYVTVNATSEKDAHAKVWSRLSDGAHNNVVQMEMIEIGPAVE